MQPCSHCVKEFCNVLKIPGVCRIIDIDHIGHLLLVFIIVTQKWATILKQSQIGHIFTSTFFITFVSPVHV